VASRIILLSGAICSGKTTLGDNLVKRHNFAVLRTKDLIAKAFPTNSERKALQDAGDRLDRRTRGRWIADALSRETQERSEAECILVDSVRIKTQIDAVRDAFGHRVAHVHLTAPSEELARRYKQRKSKIKELPSYDDARINATERDVGKLEDFADIVVDTARCTPEAVVVRVAAQLGLYGRSYSRLVDVLVGGQFGSEGKGNVSSYLADEYDYLVRVGGPNAGHKVCPLTRICGLKS